jgi:Family of unknown function (DUF6459)
MTTTDLSLHGTRTFEPPYDDESGAATAGLTDGSLALALALDTGGLEGPTLRLLPGGREKQVAPSLQPGPAAKRRQPRSAAPPAVIAAPEPDDTDDVEKEEPLPPARRTPRHELPPPRIFGARLVQALSEATAGERPLAQLSPYLSRTVYRRLERHFAGTVRGTGGVGPDNRSAVRSVRVCEPSDGVAELAAVVRRGGRMAAIALRLEGLDGRWQCTALQMG